MNVDERDETVRGAFQELRDEELRALPPFERGLARSSGDAVARTANHRAAWLAAAAVLFAVGVGLIAAWNLGRPPVIPIGESKAGGLVAWRSPTEGLLQTTGRDLMGELPRFGAFDFEDLDSAEARTKEEGPTPLRR